MAYKRVHRARSYLPRLGAALACLLNILLISAPALTPAPAAAEVVAGVASLTTVGVSVVSPKETRVLLTFNQILPQFSIVTNDAERVEVGFGGASRGAGAVAPPAAQGLLKGVEFSQRGQVLSVFLVGVGPVHVTVQPMNNGTALLLTVTPAPQQASTDDGLGHT